MQILHLCPANLATGGTEGIHNLVHHLNLCGAEAKILYIGDKENPQPEAYKRYECEYVTEFPEDFDGCVIFPEVWANQVLDTKYEKCRVAVNWQGVDVYYWNNPKRLHGLFLNRSDVLHIANSEYAMDHLKELGLKPIKISDCLNDAYFNTYLEEPRINTILYNPTPIKLTQFQKIIMTRLQTEYGIKFTPISGYTQDEVIDLFRHSKLYIDFGVFSGRERLPREAVMCGCCIVTSKLGTAAYFADNSIPDKYKCVDETDAIKTILTTLKEYDSCKQDFDEYRKLLKQDKDNYLTEVKELYNAIQHNNTST